VSVYLFLLFLVLVETRNASAAVLCPLRSVGMHMIIDLAVSLSVNLCRQRGLVMSISNERVRVLIADADHMGSQLMASALGRFRNEFEVVGIACSPKEAFRKVDATKPDVAVLSAGLQDGEQTGLRVLEQMRGSHPDTTPIVLLQSVDRDTVIDAFCSGARGILSRDDSFQSLAKCIRCVHNGQIWANNSYIEFLLEFLPQLRPRLTKSKGADLLTPREREVTRLVAEGKKNREIAEVLNVTEHTVSNYLYRIFEKLQVTSRVQLILYALSTKNVY
jgi:two-component system nitrate/nitrite response regulator NarL